MQTDYVIAWVDGEDAGHKALRRSYLDAEKRQGGRFLFKNGAEKGNFEAWTKLRWQDNGEIYYNIASVLLYAPFIRRIFLVTDGQKPPLLDSFVAEGKCGADFIRLVSHDEIFKAGGSLPNLRAARPSFNSLSIESVLWRIPDLSEHFIYANDDLFFNAPAKAEDFFKDGIPVLRCRRKSAFRLCGQYFLKYWAEKLHIRKSESDFDVSRWLSAAIAVGLKPHFWAAGHNLHPLRKSVLAGFFSQNPKLLNKQLAFRFRSLRQFNPVALANILEIERGDEPLIGKFSAYLDDIEVKPEDYARFLASVRNEGKLFACIQGMGLYPPAMQADLHKILTEKFADTLPNAVKRHLLRRG